MPSSQVIRSNYRRAKSCRTCRSEDKRFCGRHNIPVMPDMVCDDHADDPLRASVRVLCTECAFGKAGDHSCADGCRRKMPDDAGCYAGRQK